MTTRVLLADDHDIVRHGLRALLEREPDLEVVAEAPDGRSAVSLTERLGPDIVVMDVAMPGLNGAEATRQIRASGSRARVLALSMHSADRVVAGMLQAGASGYLLKNCILEELVRAVRAVVAGKVYISPDVAGGVVSDYLARSCGARTQEPASLTSREREVLQLVSEGRASKEIAAALGVTLKTVEAHRARIARKLGLRSVAELTKYAIREGLTTVDG